MTTNIMTISDLKKNINQLDVSEPIIITQNGKPSYVIESYDDYMARKEKVEKIIDDIESMLSK